MDSEKKSTNELTYKTEIEATDVEHKHGYQGVTDVENKLMVTKGRINQETGIDIYTLLYIK